MAAALIMAACQQAEIESTEPDSGDFHGHIETADATKTYLEGATVRWDAEDKVGLFEGNVNSNAYTVYGISDNGASCSFSPATDASAPGEVFNHNIALYPYTAEATASITDGEIKIEGITLDSELAYRKGTFDRGSFPMVAVTGSINDKRLNFKNACGCLNIRLRGTETIKSISLQGNDDENLAGAAEIYVSHNCAPEIAISGTPSKTITINCTEQGVTLQPWDVTDFIFPLPPMTFSKGFTVTAVLTDNSQYTITTDSPQTIVRSAMLSMKATSLQGTVLEGGDLVDIKTVETGLFDIKVNALIKTRKYFRNFEAGQPEDKETRLAWFTDALANGYIESMLSDNPYPTGVECSLTDIAQVYYVSVRPGTKYDLYIIPYVEGKTDYTLDDVYLYSETTTAPTFNGDLEVSVSPNVTFSYAEAQMTSDGAAGIYYSWVRPAHYEDVVKNDINGFLSSQACAYTEANNITACYSFNADEEAIYLVAAAIDKVGRIGKAFVQKYSPAELQFNDITITDVTLNEGSTRDNISFSIQTDKDSYGYYCILLNRTDNLFSMYDRESLVEYLIRNKDWVGYYNPQTAASCNYTHNHSGGSPANRSVFIVMALNAEGEFSEAHFEEVAFEPTRSELSNWGVVGSFNDWGNNNDDVEMGREGEWLVAHDVHLNADNAEFKFRQAKNWAVNYGSYGYRDSDKLVHYADKIYTNPSQDGPNIIVPYAGTYDIYLSIYFDEYYYKAAE